MTGDRQKKDRAGPGEAPRLGEFSTRYILPREQGFSLLDAFFYEAPSADPRHLEIWCYTDRLSYAPGEDIPICVSTTADRYSIEIIRDGWRPKTVFRREGLAGVRHATPADAYASGCGWPAALCWRVPDDLESGGYLIRARAERDGKFREQHHFFVVRPFRPRKGMVLIAATSTWIAYNDWGGASHYQGIAGPTGRQPSPVLSIERPFSRGFCWLPAGAPRMNIDGTLPPHTAPRYVNREWAFANGFARFYASAGWAQFERLFVVWAEDQGYALDMITQHDLHQRPDILDGYACAVLVGHDEYWSWEMRDAIDRYVERGGNVARFGANFLWQVRLEDSGRRQICYKYQARVEDPLRNTDRHRLSSAWEDPLVGRPGAQSLGLNGLRGIYARIGAGAPRAAGFTVYRPDHWAFAGTDLYYGDLIGGESNIYGYEVDSVEYTFHHGLPRPTFEDGAPESLEILAMGPATSMEEDHGIEGAALGLGDSDAVFKAKLLYGEATPETIARAARGAGMMAVFSRGGGGTVFNAATCEWVVGLQRQDHFVERITRNVLDRLGK